MVLRHFFFLQNKCSGKNLHGTIKQKIFSLIQTKYLLASVTVKNYHENIRNNWAKHFKNTISKGNKQLT